MGCIALAAALKDIGSLVLCVRMSWRAHRFQDGLCRSVRHRHISRRAGQLALCQRRQQAFPLLAQLSMLSLRHTSTSSNTTLPPSALSAICLQLVGLIMVQKEVHCIHSQTTWCVTCIRWLA